MFVFAFIAAGVALYFLIAASRQPRAGVIIAAIAWLAYAAYEVLIASAVLCDASCNIRVDLILIWPVLWVITLFGIYGPGQWTATGKVIGGASAALVAFMAALSLYIVFLENPAAERAAQPAAPSAGSAAPAAP